MFPSVASRSSPETYEREEEKGAGAPAEAGSRSRESIVAGRLQPERLCLGIGIRLRIGSPSPESESGLRGQQPARGCVWRGKRTNYPDTLLAIISHCAVRLRLRPENHEETMSSCRHSYSRFCAVSATCIAVALPLVLARLEARPFRPGLIPNGEVNRCENCHGTSFELTAFGLDVRPNVTVGGVEEFWGPELAALDSDGDGRTNGEELQDPLGLWKIEEPLPGDPSLVTNPGMADDAPQQFRRGDPNADGILEITDAVVILEFAFQGRDVVRCLEAADIDNSRTVEVTDAVALLEFLFLGSGPPTSTGEGTQCSADPDVPGSSGDLGCELYEACE